MTRIYARTIAVVTLLVSLSFASPRANAQSNSAGGDEAGIRQALTDFVDAFNRHDAHGWAAAFAEDGDFTNVTGLTRHGRKQVEERFTGLFAGPLKSAHRTVTIRHIRFLTPEIAAGDADQELTGSKASDGSENPVRKGLFTWVMTRQNGHWLFAVFHEYEFVSLK